MKHVHNLKLTLAAQSKSYTTGIPLKHHQISLEFKQHHTNHIF